MDDDGTFVVPGFEEFAKPTRKAKARDATTMRTHGSMHRGGAAGPAQSQGSPKLVSGVSAEELEDFQRELDQRGIVYISRVPPYMKPEKVRHELQAYGDVMRIYLTPEERSTHLKRKRFKGNSKKKYIDGWVEFRDKKVAKSVAQSLNATSIGGKKRHYYHDDLWNLKFLPGFKWRHLTESITEMNAERKHKLRDELAQAKRERAFYLTKVEQAKGNAAKEARLTEAGRITSTAPLKRPKLHFRQREPVDDETQTKQLSQDGSAELLRQADEAETDNGGLDSPSEGTLACPIRVTLEDSAAVAVAATAAATFTVCENG